MKRDPANSFETSDSIYQLTRRHTPEDLNLLIYLLRFVNRFTSGVVFLSEHEAAAVLFVLFC